MNCEEFKTLAASYALGALDGEEREKAKAHLQQAHHEGCLEALRTAEDDLVHMAKALVPIRPRPELWLEIDRLVDKRAQDWPARRSSSFAWFVAAAASIFALVQWSSSRGLKKDMAAVQTTLASTGANEQRARMDCLHALADANAEAELQRRALDALHDPAVEVVTLAEKGTAPSVRALWNAQQKTAFVIARGAQHAADKDYELWVIRGQQKIAAGLLKADAQGLAVLEVDRKLLEGPVDAFVVTLEPAGGGPSPLGPATNVGAPKKG